MALGECPPGEARRGYADDAVPAAGEPAELGGPLLDDEAEGDRHHGEVGAAHAQRRDGKEDARDAGKEASEGEGGPEGEAGAGRQDAHHVGADGVEGDVAERDLAGEAEQHVEADRRRWR